jgi:hypothetical protein
MQHHLRPNATNGENQCNMVRAHPQRARQNPSLLHHHPRPNATNGENQCNTVRAHPRELVGTLAYCNIT